MNHLKQIAAAVIALSLVTTVASAATETKEKQTTKQQQKPDAILHLSGGSFAAGIGFSWGKGTLTYKGKDYPVSVSGLSLGKLGISKATAMAEVYDLKQLRDFDGNYTSASIGLTLAGGRTGTALKNQNGVKMLLASTTRGFDVTIGGSGVTMKIKQ